MQAAVAVSKARRVGIPTTVATTLIHILKTLHATTVPSITLKTHTAGRVMTTATTETRSIPTRVVAVVTLAAVDTLVSSRVSMTNLRASMTSTDISRLSLATITTEAPHPSKTSMTTRTLR